MNPTTLDDEQFDFDELADLYQANGAINPPSEWHGVMCGKLIGGAQIEGNAVIAIAVEHMGVDKLQEAEDGQLLIDIYERLARSLLADDMSFKPLLPDDDYALSERVEALACWVRGFLEGIALQMGPSLMKGGDDVREILQDLVDISQIDAEVDEDDASEMEFMEVVEHVRLSVLSLYFSVSDMSTEPDAKPPTIH